LLALVAIPIGVALSTFAELAFLVALLLGVIVAEARRPSHRPEGEL
jgi:hypothetical protein